MPESKTTPAPEEKKNDAPITAAPTSFEQKKPAPAKADAVAPAPKQPESIPNISPKEPPKVSSAPSTAPPTPPKTAPPKQTEEKGKAAPGKKPESPKQAAPEVKKPEEKSGKGKVAEEPQKEQPGKNDSPKTAPPAEPKKEPVAEPNEKAAPSDAAKGAATSDRKKEAPAPPAAVPEAKAPADPKQPEVKPPAADPKDKPVDAPKVEENKGPLKVDGQGKVEIPIEQKGKEDDSKAPPAKDPPKKETATEPPKGVKITKVFSDRLDKPTQADLEKLPIPQEGEGFSMRLHPAYFFEFLDHPFSVNRETQDYKELFDSIKENGINEPIKARPREGGGLELISGHRRHDVAMQLNYPVPVVIVQADDDTAQIEVVDGNLHRLDIPTSELARAAKMKIAAVSRKVGRRSKMDQLAGPQKRTDQLVAEEMGMSRTQLTRLVRIDSLVPEMKKMVDDKTLPFNVAVELSYMTENEQHELVGVMKKEQTVPSLAQAQKMKEASQKAAKAAEEAKRTPKPPLQIVSTTTKTESPSATAVPTQPTKQEEQAPSTAISSTSPNPPVQPNPAPATPASKPPALVDAKQFASMMKNKPEPELKVTFSWAELKDFFSGKSPTVPEVKTAVFEGLGMRKRAHERREQKQAITNPTR